MELPIFKRMLPSSSCRVPDLLYFVPQHWNSIEISQVAPQRWRTLFLEKKTVRRFSHAKKHTSSTWDFSQGFHPFRNQITTLKHPLNGLSKQSCSYFDFYSHPWQQQRHEEPANRLYRHHDRLRSRGNVRRQEEEQEGRHESYD